MAAFRRRAASSLMVILIAACGGGSPKNGSDSSPGGQTGNAAPAPAGASRQFVGSACVAGFGRQRKHGVFRFGRQAGDVTARGISGRFDSEPLRQVS